jgi:hypothetical protein
MKPFIATAFVSLMAVSGAAFAVPTEQQVENALQQGHWQQRSRTCRPCAG